MTVDLQSRVKLLATQLGQGQHQQLLCPKCKGGHSGERTLSINVEGGRIKWLCFRAKCGFKGASGMTPSTANFPEIKQRAPLLSPFENLPAAAVAILKSKYELTAADLTWEGLRWTAMGKGRVAFPIKDRLCRTVGYTLRSFSGETPKTLTYLNDSGAVCMSFHAMGGNRFYTTQSKSSKGLVVLEDQLSAIKTTRYAPVDCCALLSTQLSTSKIDQLVQYKPRRVIFALDEDAKEIGAKYVRQLQGIIDNVSFMPLKKDLKDTPSQEITAMFKDL